MKKHEKILVSVSLVFLFLAGSGILSAQTAQDKKAQFEEVFSQAEKLFASGNYRNAVERYFFASKLAQGPEDYSRVYFGMALSYYYLKDTTECERYIRHVLEVDPKRSVSVSLYPVGFVQMYDRIRGELKIAAPPAEEAEKVEPAFKPQPVSPPLEAAPRPQAAPPEAKPATPAQRSPVTPSLEIPKEKGLGGRLEVMAFGSSWSVNLIKGLFEDSVVEDFSTEIRRVITTDLRDVYKHHSLVPVASHFETDLAFNSSGPNTGLDLRYYSRGRAGSFSLGLSFEQTWMKLGINGTVKQYYTDGSSATATVEGSATASVFSTNLSFRWDFMPTNRVSPYFIVGLGWAPFTVDITETYTGTFDRGSVSEEITGTQIKALSDIAEENDFNIPDALLIVHAGFGLRVQVVAGLSGVVEASIWDGFLLRFGAAYRF